MSESIYKNYELENEVSMDMSYFWYSDYHRSAESGIWMILTTNKACKGSWHFKDFISVNGQNTTLVITVSML